MSRNVIETVMGAVVLAVAVFFLAFAYSSADLGTIEGYEVVANFDRIDGLQPGADVKISGVRVGSIVDQNLNPETFLAEVRISLDPSVQLPTDTVAVVSSESMLGGKFLSLEPGGELEVIPAGGTILYTQSTPGLEQLLGQVIYGFQSQEGQPGDAAN